jgi:transposase
MGRAYSDDLRERVAVAVLSSRSCREMAALFSVSVASAVKWSQRLRQTGSAAAKPQGGQQPRSCGCLPPHAKTGARRMPCVALTSA